MIDDHDQCHIRLGGTARSPEHVVFLHGLGLQFAEIAMNSPSRFSNVMSEYRDLKEKLGIFYVCHGPREGDPNNLYGLEKEYLPNVLGILPLMTELEMPILTVHLWLDPRFVKEASITFKIGLLRKISMKPPKGRS